MQDELGGTIPDAVTTITLSIADNAGGATLSGTTTVNAVAGVATFNNVGSTSAAPGTPCGERGAPEPRGQHPVQHRGRGCDTL